MTTLDCRGLACPGPVMRARDLVDEKAPAGIEVLVDNEASASNVARFLENRNYTVEIERGRGEFKIRGLRGEGADSCELIPTHRLETAGKQTLVMISADRLGSGDDTLGRGLMFSFIKTLGEMGENLWRLVFLNSGVKLTVKGAETVPLIRELVESGVSVLVCGTCLHHFGLIEAKEVGETTNMLDIVTSLQVADNVINI